MTERIARKVRKARGKHSEFKLDYRDSPLADAQPVDHERVGVEVRELSNGLILTTYTALAAGLRSDSVRSIQGSLDPASKASPPAPPEPPLPPSTATQPSGWSALDKADDRT